MEAGLFLAALLLSCTQLRTSPVGPDTCTLQMITEDVKVSYTTEKAARGCVSRSTMGRAQEVHVLHVKVEKEIWHLQLNVSSAGGTAPPERKVLFVVICDKFCTVTVHSVALQLIFVLKNVIVHNVAYNQTRNLDVKAEEMSGETLLQQVKERYGGITSFAELENPSWIHFRVGEDVTRPEECIVQAGFNTWPYLQTQGFIEEAKRCTSPSAKGMKEAHILRVQQGPEEASAQLMEVKVDVICPGGKPLQDLDVLLILQGPPSMTWNIDTKQNSMKFLTSGTYLISKFPSTQIDGDVHVDNEQDLISLARKKDFVDITSYAAIPSASHLTLQLHKCEPKMTTPPPTSAQSLSDSIQMFFNLAQPWRCTDDSIELVILKKVFRDSNSIITEITLLDPSCRAEQNTTHFVLKRYLGDCRTMLEGSSRAKNELIVTLASYREKVTVPFVCNLSPGPHLQLYRTQDFKWPSTTVLEVNKPAYVQVSFRAPSAETHLELEECWLQAASEEPRQDLSLPDTLLQPAVSVRKPTPDTLSRELHQFSFVYSPAGGRPVPRRVTLVCRVASRFDGTVEEIALEVTLQGAEPSSPNQGLGIEAVVGITVAAFLIGALLTAAFWYLYSHTRPTAAMQPVASAVPASESSSTNHSIGSTQSTPCSTSSMA
uniref:Endoglin n=1 Tax=Pelusios castaneus TaxID=367368 RepID=A0A8C8RPL6_9SAUR